MHHPGKVYIANREGGHGMPWTYHQRSGLLEAPDGTPYQGPGVYSGQPPFRNEPTAESRSYQGPIPRGPYRIDLAPYDSDSTGPYTLKLEPQGHNAHGRTDFRIHGDSITRPRFASTGCIVAPRSVRQAIVNSRDNELNVVED